MITKDKIFNTFKAHIIGLYEFAYNESSHETQERLNLIYNSARNADEALRLILDLEFITITALNTNNIWDITHQSFLDFVKEQSQSLQEIHSFSIQEFVDSINDNDFLIEFGQLSSSTQKRVKAWLLH